MTTPEPTILDAEAALRLLEEVVAEKGADYIYPPAHLDRGTCRYLYNGEPDCLVGCVLVKAGVPKEELSRYEKKPAIKLPWRLGPVVLGSSVHALLKAAQEVQDLASLMNEPRPGTDIEVHRAHIRETSNWGKALDAARSLYASMQ